MYFAMDSCITCITKTHLWGSVQVDGCPWEGGSALCPLTLVDVEEGLAELVGEEWLRKVPKELLHHIRHIVSGLVLVADVLWKVLIHLT